MNYLIYYGLMIVSGFLGVLAFSQILGAIKSRKERKLRKTLITIVSWVLFMAAVTFLAWWFLHGFHTATIFGYGFGLIVLLFMKNQPK